MNNELKSILERINNQPERAEALKILIYGPSGVGKTTFYDGIKDALILDVEDGTTSLQKKAEMRKNGTRIFQLESWEDLQGIFQLIQQGELSFTNIVLDSVTEIQELCKDHVLATQDRRRVSPETPSQQDYGVISERMRRMLRNFRSLDSNIIYIARERYLKDESTGEERVRPDVSGKLQDDLPGAMDIVGYMVSKGGDRKIGFDLEGKWLAKDRTNRLEKLMEDPTWDKMEKVFPELITLEKKKEDLAV
ncbi:hypothetical protein DCC39_10390 [Pueribacillus theae]|uniref:DNA-binding protein n=1 Tax=Pueribacillus theae TaxID=2171751 RepID=A0A2U1K2A6_9BACI|nr:ATP-binding protein [Pueribacillus theae]PWA11098.1 hypothetical protein DCC39_10390 [Pueribacillus theae]